MLRSATRKRYRVDSIDLIRAISTLSLACWVGAGSVALPLLWRNNVHRYPLLWLLNAIAILFVIQAGAFMDAAWALPHDEAVRLTGAIVTQRLTSILAAVALVGVLRCVVRRH
jgi:hypothetical protein